MSRDFESSIARPFLDASDRELLEARIRHLEATIVARDAAEEMRAADSLREASDEAVRAEFGRRFGSTVFQREYIGRWLTQDGVIERPTNLRVAFDDRVTLTTSSGKRYGKSETMQTMVNIVAAANRLRIARPKSRTPAFVREATEKRRKNAHKERL